MRAHTHAQEMANSCFDHVNGININSRSTSKKLAQQKVDTWTTLAFVWVGLGSFCCFSGFGVVVMLSSVCDSQF